MFAKKSRVDRLEKEVEELKKSQGEYVNLIKKVTDECVQITKKLNGVLGDPEKRNKLLYDEDGMYNYQKYKKHARRLAERDDD